MLTPQIKDQLTEHFSKLETPVTITIGSGEHSKKEELQLFLQGVAELSPSISLRSASDQTSPDSATSPTSLRSGLSFEVAGPTGAVIFSGIPGGHEFTSFILAVLQAGGVPPKIPGPVADTIGRIGGNQQLRFETVVSLSCNNCPEVVQALNGFSFINGNIQHEMIDGGEYPELVAERKVQSVPAVFLNGEPFAVGKITPADIVDKLFDIIDATDSSSETLNSGDDKESQSTDTKPNSAGTENAVYDMVIVGGGPAGIAAAVYSARKGLKTAIVADRIGGQVNDTAGIENLISALPTDGPSLTRDFRSLLDGYEIDVLEYLKAEDIQAAKDEAGNHYNDVIVKGGSRVRGRSVIIATGARWRKLNVPGESENIGNGVAFCPHCDGPFFKGKDVAVIGGGNSGVEAALDLSGIVKSVKVLEFGETLRADEVLLDRMETTPNIEVITSAETKEVKAANGSVTGLVYEDRASGQKSELALDGVFVQIGLVPNSEFVKSTLELNERGEIKVDAHCRTNMEGVFACGDVTDTPFKQIAVAVGEGSKASLAAFEYLLRRPQLGRTA